jgi:hypothetical protein
VNKQKQRWSEIHKEHNNWELHTNNNNNNNNNNKQINQKYSEIWGPYDRSSRCVEWSARSVSAASYWWNWKNTALEICGTLVNGLAENGYCVNCAFTVKNTDITRLGIGHCSWNDCHNKMFLNAPKWRQRLCGLVAKTLLNTVQNRHKQMWTSSQAVFIIMNWFGLK